MTKNTQDKISKTIRKKRNFCGCVTCRNRKVKCDGRRPQCLRCEKAQKKCEGYGFNLKFVDTFIVTNENRMRILNKDLNEKLIKRQQLPLMKFPKSETYNTFDKIDEQLNTLEDQCINSNKECKIGPFTVFNCQIFEAKKKEERVDISDRNHNQAVRPVIIHNSNKIQNKNGTNNTNISSILLDHIDKSYEASSNSSNFNPRILPLVPALEIHHQRKKQQDELDILFKTKKLAFNTQNSMLSSEDCNSNTSGIWIHPRLEIDAILTYQALIGSADVVTPSWDVIKGVIFAEKYGLVSEFKNRIIDKINLAKFQVDDITKYYAAEVMRALGDHSIDTLSTISFTGLLRSQRLQELIRLFVKSQPGIIPLTFNGSVLDTIVVPLLYKIIGELLVFESSVGIPGDWVGYVSENGILFRDYCDTLKRTYCMVALSMTAFSQYKIHFDDYGINDSSLKLFKCYISFREMALANLSILIKPLIQQNRDNIEHIKVVNQNLIERLLKVGLFKELLLTLILAIYQDSNLDIINNYFTLYSVLDGIKVLYQRIVHPNDQNIEDIWQWFRYLRLFYRSCSKIDLENYEINDEGFEDVKSDYNLIKQFKFNDYFEKNEYNKIEIKPAIGNLNINDQHNIGNSSDEDNNDGENGNDDDDQNGDSSYDKAMDVYRMKLPQRLAKRPPLDDKPPRTFTVNFHFSRDVGDEKQSSTEHEDTSDDSSNESKDYSFLIMREKSSRKVTNDKTELQSMKFERLKESKQSDFLKNNDRSTNKIPVHTVDDITDPNLESSNVQGKNFNALTGLAITENITMSQNEREQKFTEKDKTTILHPSSPNFKNFTRPSSIELSFGIPISLLELMERTVKLTDHKNWCLRMKVFPRNFPKFCCDLEEELINWKSDWDLYAEVRTRNGELQFHSLFHQVLYHLTVSFYNSLLVFFFRLIKEIDPNLLQHHVISTISHLEKLRMISLRSDFSAHLKIVPPFWCFFISGSDATTAQIQYRFDELSRKWFVAGNKWIGKQIIMEVWKTNNYLNSDDDECAERLSWLDVIKDWEVSGFN